jgi:pyridoxine 4-dehydrogenase
MPPEFSAYRPSRSQCQAAQVRLAWTLSRGAHVLAIPGTSHLGHLAENLRAGALVREPEIMALEA